MLILGISAFYHDSAAAILRDGAIMAAAQEERFTRTKHDARFPANAITWCLKEVGVSLKDVDFIAFYEKPFLKFERLLETYLAFAPRGYQSFQMAIPVWIREKLFQRALLHRKLRELDAKVDLSEKLLFAEHHQSHAASAFFPSPFGEAAILTMDGVGEWATTSAWAGRGSSLDNLKEIHFPHSLGLLYSAFTYYTGFKVNSGEYKLMGLAPYGEPRFADRIREKLVDVKPDGSFRLNLEYFNYCTGLTMTNDRFADLFGKPPRKPESLLEPFHMDVAASIQAVLEEIVVALATGVVRETGMRRLCLSGGVALNCVANGKILKSGIVDGLWIQPASGDAGGALGAALAVHHLHARKPRTAAKPDAMKGALLGPRFGQTEIEERLDAAGAHMETLSEEDLLGRCVAILREGKVLGWFQGAMEFGPRALGARSILADPRSARMQSTLNLKIKKREGFRPFAPAVLAERASEWFDLATESPYMLLTTTVAKSRRLPVPDGTECLFGIEKLKVPRTTIPAVTHVDMSARVQTVHRETNPLFHRLLVRWERETGCPVLVNTSFNVRGEPIVCTPEDAFRCFLRTEMDALAIGGCLLLRERQPVQRDDDQALFDLD
ncbi:MAG: carbamoyltransferase [Bryobacterales bacterium]|nr:carbamoyltransferase [Bryobacterales bacterium]